MLIVSDHAYDSSFDQIGEVDLLNDDEDGSWPSTKKIRACGDSLCLREL